MPEAARLTGSESWLNCGLVRDLGIFLMSATRSIRALLKSAVNSSSVLLEWPMVKKAGVTFGCAQARCPCGPRHGPSCRSLSRTADRLRMRDADGLYSRSPLYAPQRLFPTHGQPRSSIRHDRRF